MSHLSGYALRRFRGALLLMAALATAACSAEGGDGGNWSTGPAPGTQSPFAAIAGTYRLATVNGNELSVPWETDGVFANTSPAARSSSRRTAPSLGPSGGAPSSPR